MIKYEYKLLEDCPNSNITFDIGSINALGAQGWRVVSWQISDGGYESVLLEKEHVSSNDSDKENTQAE